MITEQIVAVKTVNIESMTCDETHKQILMDELMILRKYQNPYTVSVKSLMKDKKNIYIETEFIEGGELRKYIKDKIMPENILGHIIKQILLALKFMHE